MGTKLTFDSLGTPSLSTTRKRDELDDLVFVSVIDRDLTLPPDFPSNGDRYIPAATATGDWTTKEDKIVFWNGNWASLTPTVGMKAWLEDEKIWIEYDGSKWVNDVSPNLNVQVQTSDYTVLATENGGVFVTTGAVAAVTFTLPPALPGMHYHFVVDAVQELRIDPNGTETIVLPATGVAQAAGKYITANAVAERIHICCFAAGAWNALDFVGTWTAEA